MDLEEIPGLRELWGLTRGDRRIKVAVLDGHPDLTHPCFAGADLELYPTDWNEGEIVFWSGEHATHVASQIFGQHGSAVPGVAPACRGLLIPTFRSENDAVSALALVRALDAALASGCSLIHIAHCLPNVSGACDPLLEGSLRSARRQGVLVVAPAGNNYGECYCFPAVMEEVLAVGALGDDGLPRQFSNHGPLLDGHGVMTFGQNMLGARPGGCEEREQGTSVSAPVVTGVCALLLSLLVARGRRPDVELVRQLVLETALPCSTEHASRCLRGILNIPGILDRLLGPDWRTHTAEPGRGLPEPSAESSPGGPAPSAEPGPDVPRLPVEPSPGGATPSAEPGPDVPRLPVEPSPGGATPSAEPGPDVSRRPVEPSPSGPRLSAELSPAPPGGLVASTGDQPPLEPPLEAPAQPDGDPGQLPPARFQPSLVFALGGLEVDFLDEGREEEFARRLGTSPRDTNALLAYLETHPQQLEELGWVLHSQGRPRYVLRPVGRFRAEIYRHLWELKCGLESHEEALERISLPGMLTPDRVELQSGQAVPVVDLPLLRGMYGWSTASLLQAVDPTGANLRLRRGMRDFLERIYGPLENPGLKSRDRALNFAATNIFQAAFSLAEALQEGFELWSVEVEKSPFCRLFSDCWEVQLKFQDPENCQRAYRVHRFTIDVSDVMPVTMGSIRAWASLA